MKTKKTDPKKIAIVVRKTPFNSIECIEVLRMAIGLTACDNIVSIFFMDDGVWNGLKLSPGVVGRPEISDSIEHLSLCNVKVFADEESLRRRGIYSKVERHVYRINRDEAYEAIIDSDVVISV